MFSSVEENYIKGLISAYAKQGYKYYICHTVTESYNNYDIYIYFSKSEIEAITPLTFDVSNGIYLKIDSSSRNDNNYNPSTDYRIIVSSSNFNNVVSVDKAEFIYTNATVTYSTTDSLVINPDITLNNSTNYLSLKMDYLLCCLVCTNLLFLFISKVLRLRK